MKRTWITIFAVFFALTLAVSGIAVFAADPPKVVTAELRFPIPGMASTLTLCQPDTSGDLVCEGIAQYIVNIYTWLIGVIAILAVVALMVGGIQWLIAGGSEKRVTAAKKTITNSLVGFALSLASYLFLWTISPNLVQFRPLILPIVKEIKLKVVSITPESGMADGTIDKSAFEKAKELGIYCPRSGGPDELTKIINSLENKVAYRFGGDGGPPPYKEIKKEYLQYNTTCPNENLCFDCGGYIDFVLQCAGMNAPGMGTLNIFRGAEEIRKNEIDRKNFSINGVKLEPGDLIGHGGSPGHVVIYIKDGIFSHAHNGHEGRKAGANPSAATFDIFDNDWATQIRRYNSISRKNIPDPSGIDKEKIAALEQLIEDSGDAEKPESDVCILTQRPPIKLASRLHTIEGLQHRLAAHSSGDRQCRKTSANAFDFPGIVCPQNSDISSIPDIVASLSGKVAYRLGANGGSPPYSEAGKYRKYNNNCPKGQLCLDCSGFTNLVWECAGFFPNGDWTGDIFDTAHGAKTINTYDIKNYTVNDRALQPGDLIGFKEGWKNPITKKTYGTGHVYIYLGNGVFTQSAGGKEGRKGGNNPADVGMSEELMKGFGAYIVPISEAASYKSSGGGFEAL